MITEDDVMQLLAAANPVPDVDAIDLVDDDPAAYLTELHRRSSDVTQIETRPTEQTAPPTGRSKSGGRLLVAAAVVAVVVAGIAVLTSSSPDEPVPATIPDVAPVTTVPVTTPPAATEPEADEEPEPEAEEAAPPTTPAAEPPIDPRAEEALAVGTEFAERAAVLDVTVVEDLGIPGPLIGLIGTGADLPNEAAFREAVGWTDTVESCEISSTNPLGANVACEVVQETAFNEALGVEPARTETIYVVRYEGETHAGQTLDATRVVERRDSFRDWARFATEAWEPFAEWIQATHPEDQDVMFNDFVAGNRWAWGVGFPAITDESVELWRIHTAEFVNELTQP